MEIIQKLRIIAYTENITECDCCGKTDLKGTYVMTDDEGSELYYGTVCGAKAAGKTVKEFKTDISEFKKITKLSDQLNEMLSEATCEHHENLIAKFVIKKKMNLISFLTKHGKMVEKYFNFTVYQYGSVCYNVEETKVYLYSKIIYQL